MALDWIYVSLHDNTGIPCFFFNVPYREIDHNMMEKIVVCTLVLVSLAFVISKIRSVFSSKNACGSRCGCGGKNKTSTTSPQN